MLVVFDFDGTLADTRPAMLEIFNRMSGRYHFKPITPEQLESLRSLPARDVLASLHVNPLLLYLIFRRARRELQQRMEQVPLAAPGLKEALAALAQKPEMRLGVLTSNTRANVLRFFAVHDIREFAFIANSATLWSKGRSLRRLQRRFCRPGESLVYVGDEIRDIDAAEAARVRIGLDKSTVIMKAKRKKSKKRDLRRNFLRMSRLSKENVRSPMESFTWISRLGRSG